MNRYNIDDLIINIVEAIYPHTSKRVHGKVTNYPNADANIDDCNKAIDEIAAYMKTLCINMKTNACISCIRNLTKWINDNNDIITEITRNKYNSKLETAKKWIEEHPVEITDADITEINCDSL